MTVMRASTPPVVLTYGVLGVVPFLLPVVVGIVFPAVRDMAGFVLALYGGLILSFLGGARWAFANVHPSPSVRVVSVSMLPSLVALALLVVPSDERRLQLLGIAVALVLHWLWDLRSADVPKWYSGLRTLLTAGAVAGLLAGAVALT